VNLEHGIIYARGLVISRGEVHSLPDTTPLLVTRLDSGPACEKREARPKKDNAFSQAQQRRPRSLEQKASSDRKPEVKKAPPKREAEPNKQRAPFQAQQVRPRSSEKKASSNRKPAARTAPPEREANSRKPQAPHEVQQRKEASAGSKVPAGERNKKKQKKKN
jgi:hypothetical protein